MLRWKHRSIWGLFLIYSWERVNSTVNYNFWCYYYARALVWIRVLLSECFSNRITYCQYMLIWLSTPEGRPWDVLIHSEKWLPEEKWPFACKKTSIFCKSTSWTPGVMPGCLCCCSPLPLSQHTQVTMKKTRCFSGVTYWGFFTMYCLYGN